VLEPEKLNLVFSNPSIDFSAKYEVCPFLQENKSINHLFVHYRFTIRIQELLKEWLGLHDIQRRQWARLNIK
jgi:hypothetical protein